MKFRKQIYICLMLFIWSTLSASHAIQQTIPPLKIGIVGAHDPNYDHIGKYSHLNKMVYALKHGYMACLHTEFMDENRLGYWYKVIAVKKHLPYFDWILYLDSDALIMNDDIRIETLIDEQYDVIATTDGGPVPILSGQFLIKNSEWSKQFLQDWYDIGDTDIQPGFDGGALIKLYSENEDIRNHIKILPIRSMGSYSWDYKEGDFAIQFAGYIHGEKESFMKEFYEMKKRIDSNALN